MDDLFAQVDISEKDKKTETKEEIMFLKYFHLQADF